MLKTMAKNIHNNLFKCNKYALKNIHIKLFFQHNFLLGHLPNLKCTINLK